MEPHGGAVVAVVVRVVIPLFLTRVDAVGAGRVQELLVAVDAAHEAAAANEHDRVATCLVAGALTTMTAADIGELHALIVEQEARAQHDAIVPDEHECPSAGDPRSARWRPRTARARSPGAATRPTPSYRNWSPAITSNLTVTVFGAYGHTGRFVLAELRRRAWTPIAPGRDAAKLQAIGTAHPDLDLRCASVDDPASLDRAIDGAAAVINCAGPFAETTAPVIEAALRAGIPYLDVAAEIEANLDTFELFSEPPRDAGIVIVPGMAFYGGLGAFVAPAAMGDWPAADEVSIAYGLSSWQPTWGTRAAGRVSKQRRDGRRIVFSDGRLELRTDAAPVVDWTFPAPLGTQPAVAEFTMADTVTIARHLRVPEIRSYMTMAGVKALSDPEPPPPEATDERGRSAQTFVVEVVAHRGGEERRARASGRDIYAISAPLVVEATQRVLSDPAHPAGVFAAGEVFDAQDVLRSLSPEHLSLELP